MLKTLTAALPDSVRTPLRSFRHHLLMARGTFRSPEPEWDRLSEWLGTGDVALDIGANVGHYTCRMSELVGPTGRVVAFEPVPATFGVLTNNASRFPHQNVTLVNAAVGDHVGQVGLTMPGGSDGGYLARVDPDGTLHCLVLTVDSLALPNRVALVKIDAEGYEPRVLAGMSALLRRDRPVVVLERNRDAEGLLEAAGYQITVSAARSPNVVAVPG